MHIGIYTETALPKLGGQEMVVDSLARQFLELGHRVAVLAPYPRRPLKVSDRDFPYPIIRHPRFYSTKRLVSAYGLFLRRFARQNQFDVLHCHGLYPPGFLAARNKDRLNLPVVLTSHGGDVYEKNRRMLKLRGRFELAARSADRLIAISEFTRQGLLRLGADERRIVGIPNGVNYEQFAKPVGRPSQASADLKTGEYFLFIGRLVARKGVGTLLRAFAQIQSDVRLAIAGDGDQRRELEALCGELGLTGRVHFLGAVRGELKTYLFQNTIATIVPSHHWEAFGLVVVESYASGRPVIVTRHPGLADLVMDEKTGYVVDSESVEQLAGAMAKMIGDPTKTGEMGRAAQMRARDFSWRSVAEKHIALYKSLMKC